MIAEGQPCCRLTLNGSPKTPVHNRHCRVCGWPIGNGHDSKLEIHTTGLRRCWTCDHWSDNPTYDPYMKTERVSDAFAVKYMNRPGGNK